VRGSISPKIGHKRKRSEDHTGDTREERIPPISSSDDDDDDDDEDEDLDDNALILKMVSSSDASPNSWSSEDVERILSCVKPGTYEVSRSGLKKVAARVSYHPIFRNCAH